MTTTSESTHDLADWRTPRAQIAALTRSRPADDPDLVAARQRLAAARLAEHINRAVSAAPPLSVEQREQLATLLRPISPKGQQAAARTRVNS